MKKMTYFVMALAFVLGLAQCKKEKIEPQNEGNTVRITLNVGGGDNGSRAEVVPPSVNFVDGDQILVAYDGKYVGILERSNSQFSGEITITQNGDQPLYFYFLGNKQDNESLTKGSTTSCTVNISDQTNPNDMPVISMGRSLKADGSVLDYVDGMTSFTSRLYNKASLMKFFVDTPSDSPICITGMNNEVTVHFNPETEDERFEYGMNAEDGGLIKMPAKDEADFTWAIVLPQDELPEGERGTAYDVDRTYFGKSPHIETIAVNHYYECNQDYSPIKINVMEPYNLDLGQISNYYTTLPEYELIEYEAIDGQTLYGAFLEDYYFYISIVDGAAITLNGVTMNNEGAAERRGIVCQGSATITLQGDNIVYSHNLMHPGIQVGPVGTTLTITGEGSLTVGPRPVDLSTCYAAGIGSGICYEGLGSCGNIKITGGTINATGGKWAAGIGSGSEGSCGNIEITGGTINATGGEEAAGIGCGSYASCGNITITDGVTFVQATKGEDALCSIGCDSYGSSSCGTVSIGGIVYWENGNFVGDDEYYLSQSPFYYPEAPTHSYSVGDVIKDQAGNPIAMVAYVGEDYNLAIKLHDEENAMYQEELVVIGGNFNGFHGNYEVSGTYRLPSKDDWEKMFVGCGDYYLQNYDKWICDGLVSRLNRVGGDSFKNYYEDNMGYWTSTEVNEVEAYYVKFEQAFILPPYNEESTLAQFDITGGSKWIRLVIQF